MVDAKPQVVEALSTILPVHYELFVGADTETPCITYLIINDETTIDTKYAGVSTIRYSIKLWGDSINDLSQYAVQVDAAMRDLGFTRYSYNELSTYNQICLIMYYEAFGFETY